MKVSIEVIFEIQYIILPLFIGSYGKKLLKLIYKMAKK